MVESKSHGLGSIMELCTVEGCEEKLYKYRFTLFDCYYCNQHNPNQHWNKTRCSVKYCIKERTITINGTAWCEDHNPTNVCVVDGCHETVGARFHGLGVCKDCGEACNE